MSVNYSMFVRRRMEEENGSGPSPMPIIGLYAAAASLACSLAMFLNSCIMLFNLRWFSPNFFALNATWLTLLAVATKLTGDLTPPTSSIKDEKAKLSSTVFLTVAMANFFTTLGSVKDTYILTNLTALSILVITVVVDLCIQLRTRVLYIAILNLPIVLLLCMFVTIVCSALAVPSIKKRTESKYQKLAASEDEKQIQSVEELRLSITKYWVMAASASPRSVMKRLVTSVFTSIVCLFSSLISILEFGINYKYVEYVSKQSEYKWSINLILFSQYYAALPSFIIATIFLISVLGYKYEDNGIKISREEFIIESYWTEKLVEWRQSSIPMRFKRRAVRKLLHSIKSLVFTICILVQILIVMWCKFCYVLSFYLILPLVFLVHHLGRLFHKNEVSDDQRKREIDLNCFVILLDGEKQFPNRLLRKIINRVDKHVEMGKIQRPQSLFDLLLNNQSFSLSGVVEFDSNRVPSLLPDEPPNCWTLPVVTLTTIAISLPNIATQHVDWLVKSVDQGIRYASLIDVLGGLKSIKNAADVVWVGVELHNKWLDIDLERKTGELCSTKEIIKALADVAEKTIVKFKSTKSRILIENPLYLPANVLAANSMYRISQTIMLWYENSECQAEEVFGKLICMIADILAACLTNLPLLIATKCRCNAIEEREKSVGKAAILLGETEDILKHFEEHQVSSIGFPSEPLRIDEWRRYIMERRLPAFSASKSNEGVVVQTQA